MLDPGFSQTDITTLFIIIFVGMGGLAIVTTIALLKKKKKDKK